MARKFNELPTVAPVPPSGTLNNFSFPQDLVQDNRSFFVQIEMVQYEMRNNVTSPFLTPLGGVYLPLPRKINDVQVLNWSEESALSAAAGAAGSAISTTIGAGLGGSIGAGVGASIGSGIGNIVTTLGGVTGAYIGYTLNPMLTMLFSGPAFKEHQLTWSFVPTNAAESNALSEIIHYFKFNSLPSTTANGFVFKYPNLAIIKFHPNDQFLWKFKPCAIIAVQVDYSGAGGPAFFESGAPGMVNLTLQLKEIEYWTQDNYTK